MPKSIIGASAPESSPRHFVGNALAPVAVTTAVQFFEADSDGNRLFQVRAGHSFPLALEHASCFLASARDLAYAEVRGTHTYHVGILVEMAKALIDSITLPEAETAQSGRQAASDVASALRDLLEQVESGATDFDTGRATDALSAWDAAQEGGAA